MSRRPHRLSQIMRQCHRTCSGLQADHPCRTRRSHSEAGSFFHRFLPARAGVNRPWRRHPDFCQRVERPAARLLRAAEVRLCGLRQQQVAAVLRVAREAVLRAAAVSRVCLAAVGLRRAAVAARFTADVAGRRREAVVLRTWRTAAGLRLGLPGCVLRAAPDRVRRAAVARIFLAAVGRLLRAVRPVALRVVARRDAVGTRRLVDLVLGISTVSLFGT